MLFYLTCYETCRILILSVWNQLSDFFNKNVLLITLDNHPLAFIVFKCSDLIQHCVIFQNIGIWLVLRFFLYISLVLSSGDIQSLLYVIVISDI